MDYVHRKWHALWGNLLSTFWIEIIDDALDLISKRGSDPGALLSTLKKKEDLDYRSLTNKDPNLIRYVDKLLNEIADIPNEVIYWNHNYCHTARLPSEIRYMGALTESEVKGGYTRYDRGQELNAVRFANNAEMPLTWDKSLYQLTCRNYQIDIDHQDFFMVNSEGLSKLVLPNPSEKVLYGDQNEQSLIGYILVCLASCGWSCPEDTMTIADLQSGGKVSMSVNGRDVQNFTNFARKDCLFLKHSDGHKWASNENGLFEIAAKTLDSSAYLRVSSFVIW